MREVHLQMVTLLLVVFVGLVVGGWLLLPPSSGFPKVPENISFDFQQDGVNAISETLSRTPSNGAVLEMHSASSVVGGGTWTLQIADLDGGRVCDPSHLPGESLRQPRVAHRQDVPLTYTGGGAQLAPLDLTTIESSGVFYVRLCWRSDGPISLNGAYLSAQFPTVGIFGGFAGKLAGTTAAPTDLTLMPEFGETADYTIESLTEPSLSGAGGWGWSGSDAATPVRVSAVDQSEQQAESLHGFLAGLLLGVGGGALIAVAQELAAPFTRRQDARHPV